MGDAVALTDKDLILRNLAAGIEYELTLRVAQGDLVAVSSVSFSTSLPAFGGACNVSLDAAASAALNLTFARVLTVQCSNWTGVDVVYSFELQRFAPYRNWAVNRTLAWLQSDPFASFVVGPLGTDEASYAVIVASIFTHGGLSRGTVRLEIPLDPLVELQPSRDAVQSAADALAAASPAMNPADCAFVAADMRHWASMRVPSAASAFDALLLDCARAALLSASGPRARALQALSALAWLAQTSATSTEAAALAPERAATLVDLAAECMLVLQNATANSSFAQVAADGPSLAALTRAAIAWDYILTGAPVPDSMARARQALSPLAAAHGATFLTANEDFALDIETSSDERTQALAFVFAVRVECDALPGSGAEVTGAELCNSAELTTAVLAGGVVLGVTALESWQLVPLDVRATFANRGGGVHLLPACAVDVFFGASAGSDALGGGDASASLALSFDSPRVTTPCRVLSISASNAGEFGACALYDSSLGDWTGSGAQPDAGVRACLVERVPAIVSLLRINADFIEPGGGWWLVAGVVAVLALCLLGWLAICVSRALIRDREPVPAMDFSELSYYSTDSSSFNTATRDGAALERLIKPATRRGAVVLSSDELLSTD